MPPCPPPPVADATEGSGESSPPPCPPATARRAQISPALPPPQRQHGGLKRVQPPFPPATAQRAQTDPTPPPSNSVEGSTDRVPHPPQTAGAQQSCTGEGGNTARTPWVFTGGVALDRNSHHPPPPRWALLTRQKGNHSPGWNSLYRFKSATAIKHVQFSALQMAKQAVTSRGSTVTHRHLKGKSHYTFLVKCIYNIIDITVITEYIIDK
ncbi:Hypothetical predicted protein [Pelobates cultripes]|uniref:Uncharacterized protein n=1 Tax=Pelobates cultripes TaxID=61616 RepID=A0AAD1T9U0_PELCU|nr:Hypothetical predicted protein [Pelobates cultripes]